MVRRLHSKGIRTAWSSFRMRLRKKSGAVGFVLAAASASRATVADAPHGLRDAGKCFGRPSRASSDLYPSPRAPFLHITSLADHFLPPPHRASPLSVAIVLCLFQALLLKMHRIRDSMLRHVRVGVSAERLLLADNRSVLNQLSCKMCSSTATSSDQIMVRVLELVKKFHKIDSSKVTDAADFQKDLSLDSLDRVELVMAFEQEFSIEIPDEIADKLTCCADVAKYVVSGVEQKVVENS